MTKRAFLSQAVKASAVSLPLYSLIKNSPAQPSLNPYPDSHSVIARLNKEDFLQLQKELKSSKTHWGQQVVSVTPIQTPQPMSYQTNFYSIQFKQPLQRRQFTRFMQKVREQTPS